MTVRELAILIMSQDMDREILFHTPEGLRTPTSIQTSQVTNYKLNETTLAVIIDSNESAYVKS